jgi:hypothetical protein
VASLWSTINARLSMGRQDINLRHGQLVLEIVGAVQLHDTSDETYLSNGSASASRIVLTLQRDFVAIALNDEPCSTTMRVHRRYGGCQWLIYVLVVKNWFDSTHVDCANRAMRAGRSARCGNDDSGPPLSDVENECMLMLIVVVGASKRSGPATI